MFKKEFFGPKIEKIEYDISKFKEEAKELNNLIKIKKSGIWDDIKKPEGNFILKQYELPFGIRKYYEPINDDKNYTLQTSRGIGVTENSDINEILNSLTKELVIEESDELRIEELNFIFREIFSEGKKEPYKELFENYFSRHNLGILEIGFRLPKLLKHYTEAGNFKKIAGCDIDKFNVALSKKIGYECYCHDLNSDELLDLEDISLVVSYHTLDRCFNPMKTLEKIYKSMTPGTLLHIEVPIEPDGPRLRYGHLFAFHKNDLLGMLEMTGFNILTVSKRTHTGGPEVERCLVVKK